MNHPSYDVKYQKFLSLPVKGRNQNILLPCDRANDYKRSVRICEPLQRHNASDADLRPGKILEKITKKQQQVEAKKLWIKYFINEIEAYSLCLAMEKRASLWLNAFRLKRDHLDLTSGGFKKGIAWDMKGIP